VQAPDTRVASFTLEVATGTDVGRRFTVDGTQPTRIYLGKSAACEIHVNDTPSFGAVMLPWSALGRKRHDGAREELRSSSGYVKSCAFGLAFFGIQPRGHGLCVSSFSG